MSGWTKSVYVFRRSGEAPSIYNEAAVPGTVYEEFIEHYDTQENPPRFYAREGTGILYELVDRVSIEMVEDDPSILMRSFSLYNPSDATFYRFKRA